MRVEPEDLFGLGAIGPAATPAAGFINIFEVSLDDPVDLDALQADSFTLATATFAPLSAGTSPLDVIILALGDANGDPLAAVVVPSNVPGIWAVWELERGRWRFSS